MSCSIALVVEDNTLTRMGVVMLLEDSGYTALEAANADSAIQVLESRPDICLMVTDVQMPGSMDGLTLAHIARTRWPSINIVVVSARINPEELRLPKGARFLAKPFECKKLIEVVAEVTK